MLDNHNEIRAQFPFMEKFIYFDAAHYTPYPQRSVKKLNEFINTFTTDYLNLSLVNINQSREFRSTCGKLLNCEAEDIIITSNTTHGINIFANGIQLDPKDNNVAMLDSEFPAVVYPWLNREKLGKATVMLIPSDKGYANEARHQAYAYGFQCTCIYHKFGTVPGLQAFHTEYCGILQKTQYLPCC